MKLLVSIALALWGASYSVPASASEENPYVLEANDESWDDVVSNHPLILAGFFAPWCAHCKKLKPEWHSVAEHFQKDESLEAQDRVAVVSVDVVANPGLYWRYDVTSFPTIRLIRNGVALSQCDERDSDGIVTWVEERKTIAKQVPILTNNDDTASQLTKLIQSHDVSNPSLKSAVVGLFGSKYASTSEAFKSLAILLHTSDVDELKSPQLALSLNDQVNNDVVSLLHLDKTALSDGPAILLLKNFSNDVNALTSTSSWKENAMVLYHKDLMQLSEMKDNLVFNDVLINKIKNWIDNHRWPLLMEWSKSNQPFIFTRRPGFETHILLLLPQSSDNSNNTATSSSIELLPSFHNLAEKYVPNALFLYCEYDGGDGPTSSLMNSLKIDMNSLPSSIVIKSSAAQSSVSYYRRPDESNPLAGGAELEEYLSDFFGGKLEPISPKKSVPTPPREEPVDETDVMVLRDESDFDELLEATSSQAKKKSYSAKLAIVEFYAPWCGHCKKLKPEFAKAATELKSEQIVFAKADATDKNLEELSKKLDIGGYPSLFIFFDGSVLPYGGGRNYQSLVDTSLSLVSDYNKVNEAIDQYMTQYERNNDAELALSNELLIRDKDDLDRMLKEVSSISSDDTSATLAILLVPPTKKSENREVNEEMRNVFSTYLAMAGRIGADPSIIGSSDINVLFRIVETSDDITTSLIRNGFPSGVAPAISANQVPVFAVQKVPFNAATWDAPYVANTELLYEYSPAGVFSAEWSSRRGINFIKYALRPSVVSFGDNAPFHSLMENPEVMQLLLFDDFSQNKDHDDTATVLAEAVEKLSPQLTPLVGKYMKKFVIVLVDIQAKEALEYFNLSAEDLPASRLVDITEQRSYVIPLPATTSKALGSFLRAEDDYLVSLKNAMREAFDFEQIQLTPVRRIQPASEAQLARPNQLIVGEMWHSYVLERTQLDVMILYFDPNCPHCKAMRPILDKLALKASKQSSLYPKGNLAIVEMDVSANDPLEGETWSTPNAVPAIHLYPASSSSGDSKVIRKPSDYVVYEGGPDQEQLESFLLEHAKYEGKPTPILNDKNEL